MRAQAPEERLAGGQAGALVLDVARSMGATHIVWRDVYGPDGMMRPNASQTPMPIA